MLARFYLNLLVFFSTFSLLDYLLLRYLWCVIFCYEVGLSLYNCITCFLLLEIIAILILIGFTLGFTGIMLAWCIFSDYILKGITNG